MNNVTIAIIDDHPVVLEGLKKVLESAANVQQAITFTHGEEFLKFLRSNHIDVVFLDIILPDGNGIHFCKKIKKLSPNTMILGLSNQAERSIIMQMLQNGASGYLLKNASAEELLMSIQSTIEGEVVFSKEVKQIMARPVQSELSGRPSLTRREKEILQLLSQGKTTSVIAEELCLSPFTVDTHRKNLLQKFEVKNTAELLMAAVQQKIIG